METSEAKTFLTTLLAFPLRRNVESQILLRQVRCRDFPTYLHHTRILSTELNNILKNNVAKIAQRIGPNAALTNMAALEKVRIILEAPKNLMPSTS